MEVGAAKQRGAPSFPLGPLTATLAVQTLATGAAYSIPAVAPEVARHIGINPALVGVYISIVYGVGIISALLSPGYVYSRGATRVSQAVLLSTVAMLVTASLGSSVALIVLSAVLMGVAYGATAPSSTHLLVPRTPPQHMNVVLSLRQIGVPLGGMLAGLAMPPLALWLGWQSALLIQLIPTLMLLGLLEIVRRKWDRGSPGTAPASVGLGAMAALLKGSGPLRRLSYASFVYAGLQICFIAFMTTQLTTVVGFDLVRAGQTLALYQLAGVISRPIWGWLADHVLSARRLLALQGVIMCGAALLAGRFSADWPALAIMLVCVFAGATASGYTGIAYAEYARLGGPRRTEATGIGSACMFAGVMILPAAMSAAVTLLGSFTQVYSGIGILALVAGIGLVWRHPERGRR